MNLPTFLEMPLFRGAEALNRAFSLVGDRTFFDTNLFDWVNRVEEHAGAIRAEVLELCCREAAVPTMAELLGAPESEKALTPWRGLVLFLHGKRLVDETFLPVTQASLSQVPDLKSAFLSILEPRANLGLHRGPYNGVLRYHLGIEIPPGDCGIVVGGDQRSWRNGGSLVFDDSYPHRAWNNTHQTRVVLFVDFLRPLPAWYSRINNAMYERECRSEFQLNFRKRAATSVALIAGTHSSS